MEFGGNNFAYISKKKANKISNLRNNVNSSNSNNNKEEEKEFNNDNKKDYLKKQVEDSRRGREKTNFNDDIIMEDNSENFKKNKSNISRSRSRSNSCEKVIGEDLDAVYSESEMDFDEEEEIVNESKDEVKDIKPGFFQKLFSRSSNKNSSANKKLERKTHKKIVKYNVSEKVQDKNKVYEHEVDTNVLKFNFGFLAEKVDFATGDPIPCKNCNSILNKYSNLAVINNIMANNDDNGVNKLAWKCEFCNFENEIIVEQEEIPKSGSIDYFVQSVNQINKDLKDYNLNQEQNIIFCFDISGSMCVSSPLSGKHKIKGFERLTKMKNDLQSFGDGSDQFYGNQRNLTYVSRLQCLQAAIEGNINKLIKNAPNRKVGFVTFNNEVICLGDGSKEPVKLSGDNLYSFDKIKQFANENQGLIGKAIKETSDNLIKKLYELEESGQTALGPAILLSINLINENNIAGSRIVLCTDGISNIGLGSMDGNLNNEQGLIELKNFYSNLGLLAKEKGIIIDLVTFADAESKVEILTSMIEQTGGDIINVKPDEILDSFSNLMNAEIVATKVKVTVKLHKALKFRNEEEANLHDDGSTLVKEIGNVTKDSEIFVEYCFKSSEEIAKFMDLEEIQYIPFQSIIDYISMTGDNCIRVVTQTQMVSSEKEKVQSNARFDLITTNAIQKSSKLAKKGLYREAQSNALAWKQMLKNNTEISNNSNALNNKMFYNAFKDNMNSINDNMQEAMFIESESVNINQNIGGSDFNLLNYNNNNNNVALKSKSNARAMLRDDSVSTKMYVNSNLNTKNILENIANKNKKK